MKRGKQTCRILKDIRRQIAEANDIEFITSECQYQGDCLGTCPKCEAEVHYLEQQLERKRTSQETISDSTNASVMFGEVCPTPVEDTIPMVEKDTVNKQELPELPQDMGLIEITPISGEIITVKDSLTEKDSLTDVLEVAAVMPEFPGGAQELMKFISANIEYPEIAQGDMGHCRVIVRFIVDKEGNIIQPKVVRSVDPYLDKEALRIVGLMPKWKPGELDDGTKVAVRFTIPVMFRQQ